MVSKIKSFVVAGILLLGASVSLASDFEFWGYFRGPIGQNLEGGKQIQLTNPGGAPGGNEFRLGNEVGYGELNFTAHILKAKEATSATPVFDAIFTTAVLPPMNTQYGDNTTGNDIDLIQAYLTGSYGWPVTMWAGKRFYRWNQLVMDDLFYFADMSGNGAGLEHIPMPLGEGSLALLQYTDSTISGTNGNPTKDALDFRWANIPLDNMNFFDIWLAAAESGAGQGVQTLPKPGNAGTTITNVSYKEGHGYVAGLRWTRKVGDGSNELAAIYGTGIMRSLNLNADAAAIDSNGIDVNKTHRLRIVNNLNSNFTDLWSLRSALMYEVADLGDANHSKHTWASLGFRPGYMINEHFQWLLEAGFSTIKDDTENVGARNLWRVTTGPQWSAAGAGVKANPVIRAYVTHTGWNAANSDLTDASSLVGAYNANNPNSTALNGKTSLTQVGVEAEIGF